MANHDRLIARERRAEKRRRLWIFTKGALVFCCLALWLAAGYFAYLGLRRALDPPAVTPTEETGAPLYFANADYTENIFENARYLERNRNIVFGTDSSNHALTEENCRTYGDYAAFFYHYFQAIIGGDAAAYAQCFDKAYTENHPLPTRFTMQKLYDITVTENRRETLTDADGNAIPITAFLVEYKILENNGTFRDDLKSGAAQKQYYRVTDGETPLIYDILEIREATASPSETGEGIGAVILWGGAMLILGAIPVVAVVLIVKKNRQRKRA